jgi:hypothetical protein
MYDILCIHLDEKINIHKIVSVLSYQFSIKMKKMVQSHLCWKLGNLKSQHSGIA